MKYCHSESIVQLKVTDNITVNLLIVLLINILRLYYYNSVILKLFYHLVFQC